MELELPEAPASRLRPSPQPLDLHADELPRPSANPATPVKTSPAGHTRPGMLTGVLLQQSSMSAPVPVENGVIDTTDGASVVSRCSKKASEEVAAERPTPHPSTPGSDTLARFFAQKHEVKKPPLSTDSTCQDESSSQKKEVGCAPSEQKDSFSRAPSEVSSRLSEVSFVAKQACAREPEPSLPTTAAASRRSSGVSAATAFVPVTLTDCALCGKRACCQPGACFCAGCNLRMDLLDATSPSSDSGRRGLGLAALQQQRAAAKPPGRGGSRSSSASSSDCGPPTAATEASCVLCGKRFLCKDNAQSSVLCTSCLAGQH